MTWIKFTLLVALLAALGVLVAGRAGLFRGQSPSDLGVLNGQLKPPSFNANSVSSQAKSHPDHPMRQQANIAPLALSGSGEETLAKLERLVAQTPGANIVKREPDYLRAEFESRWLRFVDDAEFWFNPVEQVVEVRSASRLGRKDFGVNRARIETLRAQL